eukprot:jgi/Mesvir1/17185/Mv07606-RA.1
MGSGDIVLPDRGKREQVVIGPHGQSICKICVRQFAKYACPRCNVQYCSLACYKNHSAACTEAFSRRQLAEEMRGTTAEPETRRRMMAVLQRVAARGDDDPLALARDIGPGLYVDRSAGGATEMGLDGNGGVEKGLARGRGGGGSGAGGSRHGGGEHVVVGIGGVRYGGKTVELEGEGEEEGTSDSSDDEEGEGGATEDEQMAGVLDPRQLSPEDLRRFHAAAATGQLSHLVMPWEPWWLREDARTLALDTRGQPLVQAVLVGLTDGIPPPPSTPLPPLSTLSSVAPSPALPYHLLDVLYSYCLVLRLFNGDWHADPLDAASLMLELSTNPRKPLPAEMEKQRQLVPRWPWHNKAVSRQRRRRQAPLLACSPRLAVNIGGGVGFARDVIVADVAALLGAGRPAVLCALADVGRLLEAGVKACATGGDRLACPQDTAAQGVAATPAQLENIPGASSARSKPASQSKSGKASKGFSSLQLALDGWLEAEKRCL